MSVIKPFDFETLLGANLMPNCVIYFARCSVLLLVLPMWQYCPILGGHGKLDQRAIKILAYHFV